MKTTKRVLGIVLALALTLSLALPAGAVDTPHPMAPVITKDLSTEISLLKCGEFRTLAVEAVLPNNAEGQLEYQWYMEISATTAFKETVLLEGETRPTLTVSLTLDDYKALGAGTLLTHRTYWVEITNRYVEDGEEKTAAVTSQAQRVSCRLSIGDFFQYFFWTGGQLFAPGNNGLNRLNIFISLFMLPISTLPTILMAGLFDLV
jgi:hypothetical protein